MSDIGSVVSSTPREEDSIMNEVRNNISSPTPSDHEAGTNGVSKFFNCSSPSEKDQISQMNELTELKEKLKKSLEKGNQFRLKGNILFKRNKFKDALSEYLYAIQELNSLVEIDKKYDLLNMTNINWVRMECMNSISVCYIVLKDYQRVLIYTEEALKINPNNFIALSYRAKALLALENYKEALDVVKTALSVKYSKSLINLLKDIEAKLGIQSNFSNISPQQDRRNSSNSISNENNFLSSERLVEQIEQNEIHRNSEVSINQLEGVNKNLQNTSDSNSHSGSNEDLPSHDKKKKRGAFSFIFSILKFGKIFSLGILEFLKKYKFGLIVLLCIYIIIFRHRLKMKLLSLMNIKFN
jgi:tetratricopeptide (TPR) repeat protein